MLSEFGHVCKKWQQATVEVSSQRNTTQAPAGEQQSGQASHCGVCYVLMTGANSLEVSLAGLGYANSVWASWKWPNISIKVEWQFTARHKRHDIKLKKHHCTSTKDQVYRGAVKLATEVPHWMQKFYSVLFRVLAVNSNIGPYLLRKISLCSRQVFCKTITDIFLRTVATKSQCEGYRLLPNPIRSEKTICFF